MKNNGSASLEARIKNSRELISLVKDYRLYAPTSEELKHENYETFVEEVNNAVTPLKEAASQLLIADSRVKEIFGKIRAAAKNIRSEILEVKGKNSEELRQVNNIVKLITGNNVREHSAKKSAVLKKLKEGDPKPSFSSVSQQDYQSMLGNYRSLTALVKSYSFYNPSDAGISATALDLLEAEAEAGLVYAADRKTDYINERSKVLHYFDDRDGLTDRAIRAKSHVQRKYGWGSPEYKAMTKKAY